VSRDVAYEKINYLWKMGTPDNHAQLDDKIKKQKFVERFSLPPTEPLVTSASATFFRYEVLT
jgi:hypothetical protein